MSPPRKMDRPVRPRAEDLIDDAESAHSSDKEDFDAEAASGSSSPSLLDTGDGGAIVDSDGDDSSGSDSDEAKDAPVQNSLKSVSFGTLAKAQDAVSRKRKRGSETNDDQELKLNALRARLAEIKDSKARENKAKSAARPTKLDGRKAATSGPDSDSGSASDDNDGDNNDDGPSKSRSSKHAPTAQSTKYQVTRKRTVVATPKSSARDPRFGPTWAASSQSRPTVNGNTDKAYSFLRGYEDSEMDQLRAAIKNKKAATTEEERETLRRKLMSMTNRRKAGDAKERERDVVREHRRKEREAIAEGKKPFYLKESDIRKGAEERRVEGMKKGERTKAEARKKKRESQREMKSMPAPRRLA